MKTIYKINIILLLTVFALSSCSQYKFDDPEINPWDGEELTATTTIKSVVERFTSPTVVYSANKISDTNPLIIKGIVTSTDVGGNVYKYITVQEETAGGRAIRVSVDVPGIASIYPLGQRVSVKLNNLYAGNYGRLPQIGVYGERIKDKRVQPMGMPYSVAEKHIFPYGAPDLAAVVADTLTIAQIRNADKNDMNYKLVCIKNAWFTGQGANFDKPSNISDEDKIFAPGTNGVGFPQSREIQDGSGQSIFIATSEFAKFAGYPLPSSDLKGNITALVGWYSTKADAADNPASGEIYYQLTLRSIDDLGKGFEAYHESLKN